MTKARDISKLLSTANGKIAGENLDVSFENITDTGTEGTRVATGTTAERGSTAGQLRFNSTTGLAEYYTGTTFKSIDSPPTISSIDVTEVDSQAGGNQTIVITGGNFQSGVTVTFIGASGTNITPSTVTLDSETQITTVTPKSSFLNAQEPYGVKVENTSGLSNTLASQINVDTSPSWTTASSQLFSIEDIETGTHATVSATDIDGDTVSYSETTSVLSGAGLSLNSSTGAISGDPTDVVSPTTLNFSLRATANSKTVDRAFSGVINPTPSGGTITTYNDGSNDYRIHAFTSNGTFALQSTKTIDVLVVGGGGAGGGNDSGTSAGGGGGGGGIVYSTSISLASGSKTITIGQGATGVSSSNGEVQGASSIFDSGGLNEITAFGGGGGHGANAGESATSNTNQGGGGGGAYLGFGASATSQGNAGGDGSNASNADNGSSNGTLAGGGGGGGNASYTGGNGGNGGDYSSYFGTTYGENGIFAGGGGGGASGQTAGTGGTGGGGDGSSSSNGANATANTGGGGGASSASNTYTGGNGGSGIVLVRYQI